MSTIRVFYEMNRVPLTKEKFDLKVKNDKVYKMKKIAEEGMSLDEVKTMISAMKIREKAVALILMQSGMGMEEFSQFNECHCDPDYENGHYCQSVSVMKQLKNNEPLIKIEFPQRKSNPNEYYTFIGKDAIEHLKLYLKYRKAQVKKKPKEKWGNVTPEWQAGQPIFLSNSLNAFADHEFRAIMRTVKKQLGYADKKFTPHSFRDVFKSCCSHAGVSDLFSEFFMGHKLDEYGYNQVHKLFKNGVKKEYLKAEPYLNFISNSKIDSEKLKQLNERVQIGTDKIQALNGKLDSREDLIDQLVQNGKHKDTEIKQLSQRIEELEKSVKVSNLVYPNIIANITERLPEWEEKEDLREMHDMMRKKARWD